MNGTILENRIEIQTFTTEDGINLQDLIAGKIGYSPEFFYFGETKDGKSIYHGYKTTNLFWEDMVSIIGDSEDIIRAQRNLQKKLKIHLTPFFRSKYSRV